MIRLHYFGHQQFSLLLRELIAINIEECRRCEDTAGHFKLLHISHAWQFCFEIKGNRELPMSLLCSHPRGSQNSFIQEICSSDKITKTVLNNVPKLYSRVNLILKVIGDLQG